MNRNKSRETTPLNIFIRYFYTLAGHSISGPVLGKTFILCLPAFIFCGCIYELPCPPGLRQKVTTLAIQTTKADISEKTTDILIFNDDRLQRLDSYQRSEKSDDGAIKASSTEGHKIFTIIANSQKDIYDWAEICSRDGLDRITSSLEKERRDELTMTGECRTLAGSNVSVMMERLVSEIVLQSISCDFRDRPYEGSEIENVKIYLTNVNSEAPVISDKPYLPQRIVNTGRLVPEDLENFSEPDILCRSLEGTVGSTVLKPDIRLLCYPNQAEEETAGTPFTRLVIEGMVNGRTYYWPIDINRENEGMGIARNCQYIFDIRITRLGHTDPDIPIESTDNEVIMEVARWEEKDHYGVRF